MAKFKVAFYPNGKGGCYITLDMALNTKVKSFFEGKIGEYNAMYADGKGTAGENYDSKIGANQKATKIVFYSKFLKSLGFEGPFKKEKLTVNLTNTTTLQDLLLSQNYDGRVLMLNNLTEKQPCFYVYFE